MKLIVIFFIMFGASATYHYFKTAPTPARISEFSIKREDLSKNLSGMPALMQQAVAVPMQNEHGETYGFKVTSIQPESTYAQLGFQEGDVLLRVNGVDLDSPRTVMEMHNSLKSEKFLRLVILRDGEELESEIDIN